MLHQVDIVDIQATQRFIKLLSSLFFVSPIDLGHHKSTVAVAVAQSLTHAFLALAFVVVPGVVEEVNAAIHRLSNNTDRQLLVDVLKAEMPAAHSNRGNLFSGAAQH